MKNTAEQKNIKLARPVLIGTGAALALLLLLSLLLAALFSGAGMSATVFTPAAVMMLVLAALFGGIFSSRITKAKGLPVGLATGLVLTILIFIMNIIILHNGFGWFLFAKMLLIVISATIGGVIGVNIMNKRKL